MKQSGYDVIKQKIELAFPGKKQPHYLIHELSVYYYAFFTWKYKANSSDKPLAYTYHKNSSMLLLLCFLIFVLPIEGAVVHLLLARWSHTAAWIVTVSSVYVLILFLADYRAMVLNPVTVESGCVKIRYGLRAIIDIPLDTILSVTASNSMEVSAQDKKEGIAPSADKPNVRIECMQPIEAVLMFGLKKSSTTIYLAIDEADRFKRQLEDDAVQLPIC